MSKLMISCTVCGKSSAITDPYQEEDQEVNTRSFLAVMMTGQGRAGLATFAGMMGMLPPLHSSNYLLHNTKILVVTRDATEANMLDAAAHLWKKANTGEDEVIDVKVTCDVTWQKRGHQSLYDVVVEVLSKYCRECHKKNMDPSSPEFLD